MYISCRYISCYYKVEYIITSWAEMLAEPPQATVWGLFLPTLMHRTSFLIDGFNLYHSVVQASKDLKGATTKWLDIFALCKAILIHVDTKAKIKDVFYFSALAKHLLHNNPDVVKRHELYIKCLDSTGINVELAKFKSKHIWCKSCGSKIVRNEEKETDVALAAKLFELLHTNSSDFIVIVSGDTDLIPAIRMSQYLFPSKGIQFAFPYKRINNELANIAPNSFKLSKERYTQHQFPDPVVLSNRNKLYKPKSW